jgi:MYXO-CTERM domain-containing protein
VSYTAQVNVGPARTGTVTAGGKTFTVNQSSGCSVSLPVSSGNVPSTGGNSSFLVTTPAGCGFTATSSDPWLTPTVTATGVDYAAGASADASRSATVTVTSTTTASSVTFTVNQAPGCMLALAPGGATPTNAGGAASFDITAGSGCTWTATSPDPWLQSVAVTPTGVSYNVDVSTVPARTGTIVVMNPETGTSTSFGVVQASGCSVALPVSAGTAPAAGGNDAFAYTSGMGCVVTVTSTDSWLSNEAAADGNASYTAAENTGIARTGTMTVTTADTGSTTSFTVSQGDGCTVTLPIASGTVPKNGGTSSFLVTTGEGCTYTSTSPDAWLTALTSTATGVSFTAAPDASLARSGTIIVTNVTSASTTTFVVNQDGPVVMPVITKQPENVTVDEGAPLSLSVTATGGSLAYQWRKDGVNIAAANAATLTIAAAALSDAGSYDVVVSNPAGSVTSMVAVAVVRPRVPADGGVGDGGSGIGTGDGGADVANGFGTAPGGGGCSCDTAGGGGGNGAWLAVIGLGIALASTRRRRRSS